MISTYLIQINAVVGLATSFHKTSSAFKLPNPRKVNLFQSSIDLWHLWLIFHPPFFVLLDFRSIK